MPHMGVDDVVCLCVAWFGQRIHGIKGEMMHLAAQCLTYHVEKPSQFDFNETHTYQMYFWSRKIIATAYGFCQEVKWHEAEVLDSKRRRQQGRNDSFGYATFGLWWTMSYAMAIWLWQATRMYSCLKGQRTFVATLWLVGCSQEVKVYDKIPFASKRPNHVDHSTWHTWLYSCNLWFDWSTPRGHGTKGKMTHSAMQSSNSDGSS